MFGGMATSALAQSGEIKIGEINSYSLLPAFTEPYRKGWQLAVEEVNAAIRKYFRPDQLTVVIAGDFDPAKPGATPTK